MGLLDMLEGGHDRPVADGRITGVVRAVVTDNQDLTTQGRVQIRIPTIPDIEPWAPVCAPFAGNGYGLWCIPQVDDTVIVAFENGDVNYPIVVGSVWDLTNSPPVDLPTDAQFKRVLKTPMGHELVLDDLEMEITLTHVAGHKLTLSIDGISLELAQGLGKLELTLPGAVTLSGAVSADLKAKKTSVKGDATLDLSGAAANLTANATCKVQGSLVTIN